MLRCLKDAVMGPLYKTAFHRPPGKRRLREICDRPLPMSVSKVHQWVSAFYAVRMGHIDLPCVDRLEVRSSGRNDGGVRPADIL